MEKEYVSLEEAREITGLSEKQLLRGGLTLNYWFYHFKGWRWWKVPVGVIESLYHGEQNVITPFYVEVDEEWKKWENRWPLPSEKKLQIGEWTPLILKAVSPDDKITREIREIKWKIEALHLRLEDIYSKKNNKYHKDCNIQSDTGQYQAPLKPNATNINQKTGKPQPECRTRIEGWKDISQAAGRDRKTIERAESSVKMKPVVHREGNKVWVFEDELNELLTRYGNHKERKTKEKKAANKLK